MPIHYIKCLHCGQLTILHTKEYREKNKEVFTHSNIVCENTSMIHYKTFDNKHIRINK